MSISETRSVSSTINVSLRSSKGRFLNRSTSLQNLSLTKHAELILCIADYIPLKPFHQEKHLLKAEERQSADFNRLLKPVVEFPHPNLGSAVVRTQLQFSVHFFHAKFSFLLILTANVLMANNFLSPSLSPLNFNYRLHSKRLIFVHGWELKRWPSYTLFPHCFSDHLLCTWQMRQRGPSVFCLGSIGWGTLGHPTCLTSGIMMNCLQLQPQIVF